MAKRRRANVGWPVFSVCFTPNEDLVLVGGGGGATKAGVKNTINLFKITNLELSSVSEHLFSPREDGCMSLCVHSRDKVILAGVNSSEDEIKLGNNQNLRILTIENNAVCPKREMQTFNSTDCYHHQKVCRFSPNEKYFVTGASNGQLSFVLYPQLLKFIPDILLKTEICDLSIGPHSLHICIVTPKQMQTITKKGDAVWKLDAVVIENNTYDFRACRFGVGEHAHLIYFVLNSTKRSSSLIQTYEFGTRKLKSSIQVSVKPITAFATSVDGTRLAFGTADLSVVVMGVEKMNVIAKIATVHGFPVTSLDFSPTGMKIVSGSADGTVSVLEIPKESTRSIYWMYYLAVFLILIFILLGLLGADGGAQFQEL